jgi:hypothetical protein
MSHSSSNSESDDFTAPSTALTSPSPPPSARLSVSSQRRKLRAVLMRAGSSKGLFVHLSDLPDDRSLWGPLLLKAFGSPDPFHKQLNGVGGGVSTQSKVGIISPSSDPRADVDYLFAQSKWGVLLEMKAMLTRSPRRWHRARLFWKLRKHGRWSWTLCCRVSLIFRTSWNVADCLGKVLSRSEATNCKMLLSESESEWTILVKPFPADESVSIPTDLSIPSFRLSAKHPSRREIYAWTESAHLEHH